jgi:hypothetical protein
MSHHYVILDDRPERVSRLRFLLHLHGVQALLAIDAAEVMNWRSACRQAHAEMRGVILYSETLNLEHLESLEQAGFDLPVYVIQGELEGLEGRFKDLDIFVGSVDDILQRIPSFTLRPDNRQELGAQL